jgi:hypothetical protein
MSSFASSGKVYLQQMTDLVNLIHMNKELQYALLGSRQAPRRLTAGETHLGYD